MVKTNMSAFWWIHIFSALVNTREWLLECRLFMYVCIRCMCPSLAPERLERFYSCSAFKSLSVVGRDPVNMNILGFQVSAPVFMKSIIIWDITSCSPLSACHLLARCFIAKLISSTLKMEAICSSETPVDTQRSTRRYIPKDGTLHEHSSSNNTDPSHGPQINLRFSPKALKRFWFNFTNLWRPLPKIKLYRSYLQEDNGTRTRGPSVYARRTCTFRDQQWSTRKNIFSKNRGKLQVGRYSNQAPLEWECDAPLPCIGVGNGSNESAHSRWIVPGFGNAHELHPVSPDTLASREDCIHVPRDGSHATNPERKNGSKLLT
jgi:hypothetical protein